MSKKDVTKVVLDESDIPKQWYNILADMPNKPAPYFSSKNRQTGYVGRTSGNFPDGTDFNRKIPRRDGLTFRKK